MNERRAENVVVLKSERKPDMVDRIASLERRMESQVPRSMYGHERHTEPMMDLLDLKDGGEAVPSLPAEIQKKLDRLIITDRLFEAAVINAEIPNPHTREFSEAYREIHLTLSQLSKENERLSALLNTPELNDFAKAVPLEAAHQRERWGEAHDAEKEPQDWFWTLGYLGGKALRSHTDGNFEKAKHHAITAASLLANWHARILADEAAQPDTEKKQ
jgi:hypothetical protein